MSVDWILTCGNVVTRRRRSINRRPTIIWISVMLQLSEINRATNRLDWPVVKCRSANSRTLHPPTPLPLPMHRQWHSQEHYQYIIIIISTDACRKTYYFAIVLFYRTDQMYTYHRFDRKPEPNSATQQSHAKSTLQWSKSAKICLDFRSNPHLSIPRFETEQDIWNTKQ